MSFQNKKNFNSFVKLTTFGLGKIFMVSNVFLGLKILEDGYVTFLT